jgi:FeS assembly SUF system protein
MTSMKHESEGRDGVPLERGSPARSTGGGRAASDAQAGGPGPGNGGSSGAPGASAGGDYGASSGTPGTSAASGNGAPSGAAGPGNGNGNGHGGSAGPAEATAAYSPMPVPPPPEDGLSAVLRDAQAGIAEHAGLLGQVVEVLRDIYDPEIPVNIYELGLVYDVREVEPGRVYVRMTLTSPMCPVAESLPPEVKHRVEKVAGVREALIDITWEPPWAPDKMSEPARLQLNFFY